MTSLGLAARRRSPLEKQSDDDDDDDERAEADRDVPIHSNSFEQWDATVTTGPARGSETSCADRAMGVFRTGNWMRDWALADDPAPIQSRGRRYAFRGRRLPTGNARSGRTGKLASSN